MTKEIQGWYSKLVGVEKPTSTQWLPLYHSNAPEIFS